MVREKGVTGATPLQYYSGMVKKRAKTRQGMVVTTVALEPDLHRRLALAGLDENATMAELIRQAIREWLDRRDRKRRGRARP